VFRTPTIGADEEVALSQRHADRFAAGCRAVNLASA
jgi:hypothetical protein